MYSETILSVSLVLHIIAITLVAGTTLVDFLAIRRFSKLYTDKKGQALATLETMTIWVRARSIGFALLLLSGVTMLIVVHGVFGSQRWFQVKMILFLLIVAISLIFVRRYQKRLRQLMEAVIISSGHLEQIGRTTGRMRMVQILLLLMFVIIFALSIFRFN